MTAELGLVLAALGFVGAFVSGLVGVGGAIVMIPLLYYVPPLLGVGSLHIKVVAGVTMAQVFVAAVVGAWTHGRQALVHRPLAWTGGSAMALASLTGAVGSRYVSGQLLLGVFALMASVALPLMFIPPRIVEGMPEASVPFSRWQAIAYPGMIGLLSGLVGAGGAFLLVPVLIGVMRIPVRASIGTSLAMTGISASMGLLGKLLTAQVVLQAAAAVVLGSLCGAPIGAWVSRRAPVTLLRGVLAAVIALVTVRVWAEIVMR